MPVQLPSDDPIGRVFRIVLRAQLWVILSALGVVAAFAAVKGAGWTVRWLQSHIPW